MSLLSPKLDVVFKKLFSEPDSEPLLTDFLASVLDIDADKITGIKIINGEITPELLKDKFVRLDLTVLIDGAKIDIEMQCIGSNFYADRALYYWAKLFSRDLKAGASYDALSPTISINILNFNMFNSEEFHSTFKLMEQNRHEVLTDKCRLDFLELKKARLHNSKQIRKLERWMRFLNVENEMEADMIRTIDPIMEQAILKLRTMSNDGSLQYLADIREAQLHDEASYLSEARAEGIAEGIAKGVAKSRNIMIESMRLAGIPDEQINSIVAAAEKMTD